MAHDDRPGTEHDPVPGSAAIDEPESEQGASPDNRIFTLRAVLIAVLFAVAFSIFIPWNDWFLRNTYLNNHYMPLGLTLVLLLMGLVVNPLLGRFRLMAGEMVLIAVAMLGIAGVTSSGLMRLMPYMIAGPAEHLPANPKFKIFADRAEDPRTGEPGDVERWNVPRELFLEIPAEGDIDRNDSEHRYVVNGYIDGISNRVDKVGEDGLVVEHRTRVTWVGPDGQRHENQLALDGRLARERAGEAGILDLDSEIGDLLRGRKVGEEITVPGGVASIEAITEPPVPWAPWWTALMAWAPLLFGAALACIGIAGVVRRQWIHHERLPYPIAAVTWSLLENPSKGSRFAAVFRDRGFWIAFCGTALIITWRGLYAWQIMPVDFQLELSLYGGEDAPFAGEPWSQMYKPEWLFHPRVFFSIVALTFFLSLDLSFSLWFFFVATNVAYLFLRMSGLPITGNHVAQAGVGGFFAECLLVIWVGRQYYGRVLKAAFMIGGNDDARAAAPYLWALLGGSGLMVAFFVWLGSPFFYALLMVLLFLGFFLVLARIVAEAGVPYIGVPTGAFLNSVFFSAVGFGLPVAALMPLTVVGMTLLADSREALLPYAVNADYLSDQSRAPRKRTSGLLLAAVVIGILVSLGTMVYLSYTGDGHPDGYGRHVLNSELNVLASGKASLETEASQAIASRQQAQAWAGYGIGAGIVTLLGVGRMFFGWWPFHPIGYLTSMTYATWFIWFSFFLGWLVKALVMRYGGTGLYKRLKPVAIGMIAGEALAGGGFMIARMIAESAGYNAPIFKFLPG